MRLLAALWYVSGFREPGEVARWFYEDGTIVGVFEDHIRIRHGESRVMNDLVTAHIRGGWTPAFSYLKE